jgi:hypothetical protein
VVVRISGAAYSEAGDTGEEPLVFVLHANLMSRGIQLVVKVLGYRSGGPGSIPGTTRKKSSGSGTGSTLFREYN